MHFVKISLLIFLMISSLCSLSSCGSSPFHQKGPGLDLRERVQRVVLDNGMTFLLLKREGAPVFSAQIKVRVGNIEEEAGSRGLAHFFEHMAFKGTSKIGTTDGKKEKEILDQIFEVGTQIVEMRKAGKKPEEYAHLVARRKALEEQQKELIVPNEFHHIYQANGGIGLNASTSNDFTTYFISLPANKLELWAYLESARFTDPFMRDFFTEVNVVAEERKMRIDNPPIGSMYETFVDLAFNEPNPYKTVVIGPAEDIQNYTPKVAQAFYDRYYIPSRMVATLVGNFDMDEAKRVIKKYFSKLPSHDDQNKKFATTTFDDTFPRQQTIYREDKPRFFFGYHRPAHPDPDDIILDVVQHILCHGRTSRLYKELVLEERKAVSISCYSAFPGARLDSLFLFHGMPHDGVSNKELKDLTLGIVNKLAQEGPSEQELQKVINNIDASLIYSLESNSGLADSLAHFESLTGDWEYIYDWQKRVKQIKATDIQRVIKKYFVPNREVTVFMERKVEGGKNDE
ncbi:MAG: insulinase family protein [Deltaproteobacteria bacterium]|nr:insulinase family protein [Deltaproteobacteria bacterium]